MKMKSTTVCVFMIILILLEILCSQGCWKHEREALLGLNARFDKPLPWADGTDCCQWERVECNTTTGRVAKLDLSEVMNYWLGIWHINCSDFLVFEDLKSLNLKLNSIAGCTKNEGLRLSNLEVLDLSYNSVNNAARILSCLAGFSSLKSLYLVNNLSNATSFHAFETLSSKLLNLEVLDISFNNLTNDMLLSLGRFKSLKELYLLDTGLDSELHIQGLSSMLINLEVLDMSGNNFNEGDIASALSGLSSLKSLTIENSQLTPGSIRGISKLCSLEILDLASNGLSEGNLWSIDNKKFAWPTSLQVLILRENSFSSDFVSSLGHLQNLKSLDLSRNQLVGPLDINGLLTLNNLEILDLRYNSISNFVVPQGSKSLNRLEVIYLEGNKIDGNMLRKSLRAFSSVRELYLSNNEFKGTIVAEDFHDLGNLEHLAMDGSANLVNQFFRTIGALTSLKVLSMSTCSIKGTIPVADWHKLKKLEKLDMSFNEFEGSLPSSFCNMTNLRMLALSHNHFTGNFGSNLASLTSLEHLGFEENQFDFPVSFSPFANNTSLKFIYGNGNKVIPESHSNLQNWVPKFQLQELHLSSTTETKSLPLPNFLLFQHNLTSLDFTSCKLEGDFPNWLLENNTKMSDLVLRNCSFKGTFQLPSRPHVSMLRIDVSDNSIAGQFPSNNISSIFPNLEFLNMSSNEIHGSLPFEIGHMDLLDTLDLSNNQLSGELPKNVSGASSILRRMILSNNKLNGPVFPTLSTMNHLEQLYLDGNSFSGSITSCFFNTSLLVLEISNNHFVGKLPSKVGDLSKLVKLSMSNNHLEGSIPSKIVKSNSLAYLDLSWNNLTGSIPSFVKSSVRFIHLSNNRLSGLPKRMFGESSSLEVLDLRYNKIATSIDDMMQDLSHTSVHILLLKGNRFTGKLPKELCHLKDLTIVDLSYNNFFGPIPSCLSEIPFQNDNMESDKQVRPGISGLCLSREPIESQSELAASYYERLPDFQVQFIQEQASFTTKKLELTYTGRVLTFMTGIDLSSNKLNGNIPSELGNLTNIRALNLSHNNLKGKIPASFSNLVQIESLDLSFNKLSGQIPPQLIGLTALSAFSVAYNNLSGPTPDFKNQFATFDKSSYEGNRFLCGPPLPKSCNAPTTLLTDSHTDGHNGSLIDMYVFYVSFALSYTAVLLVIAAILYINPYWRRAWFYYIGLVSTNCYYFIEDSLCKFLNVGSM